MNCSECQGTNIKLRRNITRENKNKFFWFCEDCQFFASGKAEFIPDETIKEWQDNGRLPDDLSLIPVINDYRDGGQCHVLGCKETDVKYYHLVDGGYEWPGFYLCLNHYEIWRAS